MVKKIENNSFIESLSDLLASGKEIKIRVRGASMRPFLKEGRDSVILRQPSENEEITIGQIVLANHQGKYVLHRVYKKDEDKYELMGDANIRYKETIKREDILAYVTAIERNGRLTDINQKVYRLRSKLWIVSLSVRKPIVLLLSSIKGILRTKNNR